VKKCLGLWVDNSEKVLEIALMNKDYFPCVPVSEHEAFKEKVRLTLLCRIMAIENRIVNDNAVFIECTSESDYAYYFYKIRIGKTIVLELEALLKELGLSKKKEKKAVD